MNAIVKILTNIIMKFITDIIMTAHAPQKNMSTKGAVATTIIMKKAV